MTGIRHSFCGSNLREIHLLVHSLNYDTCDKLLLFQHIWSYKKIMNKQTSLYIEKLHHKKYGIKVFHLSTKIWDYDSFRRYAFIDEDSTMDLEFIKFIGKLKFSQKSFGFEIGIEHFHSSIWNPMKNIQ